MTATHYSAPKAVQESPTYSQAALTMENYQAVTVKKVFQRFDSVDSDDG